LIEHRCRVGTYDDRLNFFIGGTALMALMRERGGMKGVRANIVDYRHVIYA
jgi:hypothetical protein